MAKRKADDDPQHGHSAKRERKMFDGKFYSLKVDDNSDDTNSLAAQCMLCTNKTTIIKGSLSSTGNFYKHFRKLHDKRVEELKNYCDSKTKPASHKNEKVQSILPFVNTIDPRKVSVFCDFSNIFL